MTNVCIPLAPNSFTRERAFTMRTGDTVATVSFRSPLRMPEPFDACENFAARLTVAIAEGSPDPLTRARALRGQIKDAD